MRALAFRARRLASARPREPSGQGQTVTVLLHFGSLHGRLTRCCARQPNALSTKELHGRFADALVRVASIASSLPALSLSRERCISHPVSRPTDKSGVSSDETTFRIVAETPEDARPPPANFVPAIETYDRSEAAPQQWVHLVLSKILDVSLRCLIFLCAVPEVLILCENLAACHHGPKESLRHSRRSYIELWFLLGLEVCALAPVGFTGAEAARRPTGCDSLRAARSSGCCGLFRSPRRPRSDATTRPFALNHHHTRFRSFLSSSFSTFLMFSFVKLFTLALAGASVVSAISTGPLRLDPRDDAALAKRDTITGISKALKDVTVSLLSPFIAAASPCP